jgi:starch phosphorylase
LANGGDNYITCFDFYSYVDAQERVDAVYRDTKKWNEMAILGIVKSGKFSSDRTIAEYCSHIWQVEDEAVVLPSTNANSRVKSLPNFQEIDQ